MSVVLLKQYSNKALHDSKLNAAHQPSRVQFMTYRFSTRKYRRHLFPIFMLISVRTVIRFRIGMPNLGCLSMKEFHQDVVEAAAWRLSNIVTSSRTIGIILALAIACTAEILGSSGRHCQDLRAHVFKIQATNFSVHCPLSSPFQGSEINKPSPYTGWLSCYFIYWYF